VVQPGRCPQPPGRRRGRHGGGRRSRAARALAARRDEQRLGRDDARGAIEEATEALRLDPRQAEALATRGLARLKLGERDLAIADLEA